MAAEYSAIPVQTIAVDENVIFANGSRACHKGYIQHRDTSGIFFLKGSNGCNKAVYRVTFNGNIAIAEGGTVEPISIALTINGEELATPLQPSHLPLLAISSMCPSQPLLKSPAAVA